MRFERGWTSKAASSGEPILALDDNDPAAVHHTAPTDAVVGLMSSNCVLNSQLILCPRALLQEPLESTNSSQWTEHPLDKWQDGQSDQAQHSITGLREFDNFENFQEEYGGYGEYLSQDQEPALSLSSMMPGQSSPGNDTTGDDDLDAVMSRFLN